MGWPGSLWFGEVWPDSHIILYILPDLDLDLGVDEEFLLLGMRGGWIRPLCCACMFSRLCSLGCVLV